MSHITTIGRLLAATGMVLMATGCAAPKHQSLYGWEDYQPQVYTYLKNNGDADPQAQITELEQSGQKIQARGAALPPGYRAHLGMLYAKTGQIDKSAEQLTAEKAQFPEAATFMDFLLQTLTTKANQ